jgi:methylmalonyl-CoA/ethylmalonyl-CoA epimerase
MIFHHVGIACRDIDEEILNVSRTHEVINTSEIVFDQEQNAYLVMLTLADGTQLELIAGKQVENLVRKNITYYHLCFEVADIQKEIERLTANENAKLISPPKPAILFNNRPVAFLYVSYGLIELLQA